MVSKETENTEFIKTRLFRDYESVEVQLVSSSHSGNLRTLPEPRVFGKYGYDYIGTYPEHSLYGKQKEISKSKSGEWFTLTWISDSSSFSIIEAYNHCLQYGEISKCLTSFEKWISVKFMSLSPENQLILNSDDEIKKRGTTLLFHKGKYASTIQKPTVHFVSDIRSALISFSKSDPYSVLQFNLVISSRWYTIFGVQDLYYEETLKFFSKFGDLSRVSRSDSNWISIEYSSFIDQEKNNIDLDNRVFQIISGYAVVCYKGRYDPKRNFIDDESQKKNEVPVFHSKLFENCKIEENEPKSEFVFSEFIGKVDRLFTSFLRSIF
ncbi:hypothetical protein GPJ56_008328 [Histomonas meleagridis]|uniref:uncharacterized protein n=1 Tax=Histomonas meleagridis TaxID=135588 RepID=UPI003559E22C|nr:hypothetical protein GPJ56_008328 [Histomonas meleagridis]KAH0806899.1 hypothetical protein GO595_000075 [Histomonas meleagridis]